MNIIKTFILLSYRRSKTGMDTRTDICETTQTVSNRYLHNGELNAHRRESNLASEGLAMVLAANTTSVALATTRSVVAGEHDEVTPPYSTAVEEMLHRARMPPRSHSYREGVKRSNTIKDL